MEVKSFIKVFLLLLSFAAQSETQSMEGKIILDVDAGADDAFGIILAAKNEELFFGVPLVAITCVSGGTNLQNVEINVLRTLLQVEREDIPVFIGANASLVYTPSTDGFFGADGFGDFPFDRNALPRSQNEHAVFALIRIVNENPGEIILIALGPLTNIALAIKLDPAFVSKLKELVILGGTIGGIGNVQPGIEFNNYIDPEAVAIVFKASTYDKVTLLPWDTIYRSNLQTDWRGNLSSIQNQDLQFLNKAGNNSLWSSPFWHFGGPLAVAVYIWPETVSLGFIYKSTSVTCGEARGGMLVDFYRSDDISTTNNLKIITDLDAVKLQELLQQIFTF